MAKSPKTPFLILGMLAQHGPLSGYDLRKAVEQSIAYFWKESFGQIYPALEDLARRGLVKRLAPAGSGARRRILYRITPAGRKSLRVWLAEPPEPQVLRLELLLKLFFAGDADPRVARSLLDRARAEQESRLKDLRRIETTIAAEDRGSPHFPFWLLTLRHGIRVTEARLSWAEESLRMLGRKGRGHARAAEVPGSRAREDAA